MTRDKFIKILKIFIVVLSLVLLIAIPLSLLNYYDDKEKQNIKTNSCTEKGKVCTKDDLFAGVEVLVEVSAGKEYIFNVISNDENTMTLLMKKNLKREINWHSELINVKGPQEAMDQLAHATESWTNIALIDSFVYDDSGKVNYEVDCANGTAEPDYDCTTTYYQTRGYKGIRIEKGKITYLTNLAPTEPGEVLNNKYTVSFLDYRARLITLEEVTALSRENGLPNWLMDGLDKNDGYWTITSSTALKSGYNQGAVAIAKINNAPSIESLRVMKAYDATYTVGIRPVITIEKK